VSFPGKRETVESLFHDFLAVFYAVRRLVGSALANDIVSVNPFWTDVELFPHAPDAAVGRLFPVISPPAVPPIVLAPFGTQTGST
jgi:hypothetical protein